jgi:antitoxin ParD1/3/4
MADTSDLSVRLAERDKEFIEQQVEAGLYDSPADVVSAGLRALKSEELKLAELKAMIQEGLDDVAAGRVYEYESAEDMLRDIKSMGAKN